MGYRPINKISKAAIASMEGFDVQGATEWHISVMLSDPKGWKRACDEVSKDCRVEAMYKKRTDPPPLPSKIKEELSK